MLPLTSSPASSLILRAPWILPVSELPIKDGALRVLGDSIQEVGSAQEILPLDGEEVLEMTGTALLPGLVNAHAHLGFESIPFQEDYKKSFTAWIRSTIQGKDSLTEGQRVTQIQKEAGRLLETGTTTLAFHTDAKFPIGFLPDLKFRSSIFLEIVGANPEFCRSNLRAAVRWKADALIETDLLDVNLTPQSLYSLDGEVLRELFRNQPELISLHLMESQDEVSYLRNSTGPLLDLVKERGGSSLPFLANDPIAWLAAKKEAAKKLLLVHGNYLRDSELEAFVEKPVSIVHCPGSHKYFAHQKAPLQSCLEKRINVALGTDSLASNVDLSMFQEMRVLKDAYPHFQRGQILEMATLNGAKALGLNAGALERGRLADIIGVPVQSHIEDPLEAIFTAENVNFSMINGMQVM